MILIITILFSNSSFYRRAEGVLLCYAIDDQTSFNNMRQWYQEVMRYTGDDTPIVLVATKNDLFERRVIDSESGKQFADEFNMEFVETSAKKGENGTEHNIRKC